MHHAYGREEFQTLPYRNTVIAPDAVLSTLCDAPRLTRARMEACAEARRCSPTPPRLLPQRGGQPLLFRRRGRLERGSKEMGEGRGPLPQARKGPPPPALTLWRPLRRPEARRGGWSDPNALRSAGRGGATGRGRKAPSPPPHSSGHGGGRPHESRCTRRFAARGHPEGARARRDGRRSPPRGRRADISRAHNYKTFRARWAE